MIVPRILSGANMAELSAEETPADLCTRKHNEVTNKYRQAERISPEYF